MVARAQSFDALHRRGLAGAVRADQAEDLAVADVEADVVDRDRAAVGLAERLHADDGIGGHAAGFDSVTRPGARPLGPRSISSGVSVVGPASPAPLLPQPNHDKLFERRPMSRQLLERQVLPILCLPSLDSKDLCSSSSPTGRPPVLGHGWQSPPKGASPVRPLS